MSNVQQNEKVNLLQKIDQVPPAQIAAISEVADRFKQIFSVMNGGNKDQAQIKYEAEKFHFAKLIQEKQELQKCTKLSLYGCFMDMAVNGLSFDPAMKHAYVVGFPTNIGTKDNPKWETRAQLMISGYGELHMRVRQGQIKYADNPVLVYEGDQFKYGTQDGKIFLEHVAQLPRKKDAEIIGCYIRLERTDGSVDYKVLSLDEVLKFKEFSKQKNSLAWTSGLPGMIQAKTIKHAFRSYPKIRMGDFSTLQSQVVEADPVIVEKIDYGLNGSHPGAISIQEIPVTETAMVTPQEEVPSDDEFVTSQTKKEETTFVHNSDEF